MTRAAAAAAALLPLLMMIMMMMTAFAAAAPLHLSRGEDVTPHPLPEDGQSNGTRAELLLKLNVTLEARVSASNQSTNESVGAPFLMLLPQEPRKVPMSVGGSQRHCPLPTCATINLVSDMQGGDEKAGSATSDPYGIGKK